MNGKQKNESKFKTPSERVMQGFNDAKRGRPKMSTDEDYLSGYDNFPFMPLEHMTKNRPY